MFNKIISFSINNKFIIAMMTLGIVIYGLYSFKQLPIDAVPDITNNQVQIFTLTPTLATQEVEQLVSAPIERSLASLPDVEEIRSISRFGLSVVTIVFKEKVDIYFARQLVRERIDEAQQNIPEGVGTPELSPVSTGLGEVYQYLDKLLAKIQPQLSFNCLSVLILCVLLEKVDIRILMTQNGDAQLLREDMRAEILTQAPHVGELLEKSHLSISLQEVVLESVNSDKLILHLSKADIISPQEEEILRVLRSEKVISVMIRKNQKSRLVEMLEYTENKDAPLKIQELILAEGYHSIQIKTKKGKIVSCQRVTQKIL